MFLIPLDEQTNPYWGKIMFQGILGFPKLNPTGQKTWTQELRTRRTGPTLPIPYEGHYGRGSYLSKFLKPHETVNKDTGKRRGQGSATVPPTFSCRVGQPLEKKGKRVTYSVEEHRLSRQRLQSTGSKTNLTTHWNPLNDSILKRYTFDSLSYKRYIPTTHSPCTICKLLVLDYYENNNRPYCSCCPS